MNTLRQDAQKIIDHALQQAKPDHAVQQAMKRLPKAKGKTVVVSFGKAAWKMSDAAVRLLAGTDFHGICITKYGHSRGPIRNIEIQEAGHPIVDENSILATKQAERLVSCLCEDDLVIVLISGGGSALFEDPLIPLAQLQDISQQLLACGADITEINTIRKRLSRVKGGRFAQLCAPARVFTVVLSDIIGDPLDMIASGPCHPDSSTCADALAIVEKYSLHVSEEIMELLNQETPKQLGNVETHITGSVRQLCASAKECAQELGYDTMILTSSLHCQAKEAGSFLASIACEHRDENLAVICGGETVVQITGNGIGGRNQELALGAAEGIAGLKQACVFSIGSDGTDGPTDAAGGYVDQDTARILCEKGIRISDVLQRNDSYHALQECGGLIMTGPTGTNVNDLSVVLIRGK
ncbi:MAG: glycerate kinase [Bulleidia sp.]